MSLTKPFFKSYGIECKKVNNPFAYLTYIIDIIDMQADFV